MVYPKQRLISKLMQIRRQALLPEEAIGSVQARQGQRVDIRDKVARGLIPARHIIIDAMRELNLKNPEELAQQMKVQLRARVEEGQLIAGREGRRSRQIYAPFNGIVMAVDSGRIILQEMPQVVTLEAGVRGTITRIIEGRGVEIEGQGVVVQGVWGNGKDMIAPLRLEPRDGIASLPTETLDNTYRGEIVLTRHTLSQEVFTTGHARGFGGIVAPSMTASLIPYALESPMAILLTEGFGTMRMNSYTYNLLMDYLDSQATLDAAQPRRFDERLPGLVINRYTTEEIPEQLDQRKLERGMEVRITREPYSGQLGTVVALPAQPVKLENGLRVPCARVQITAGATVNVPLVNLELGGT